MQDTIHIYLTAVYGTVTPSVIAPMFFREFVMQLVT